MTTIAFIELNKPTEVLVNKSWVVECKDPYSHLYLLKTGYLRTVAHSSALDMYFDSEVDAYNAIKEYYEFNNQRFPYKLDRIAAALGAQPTVGDSGNTVGTVESEVMDF